jgi:UDP:flavonoid glycosyltransferase YjiC (YdhE family)
MGGGGHLTPLLAVAGGLCEQEHECVMLVPPSLADAASVLGIRVVTGGQPSTEVVDEIWARVRKGPRERVVGLIDRELFAELATDAMLDAASALAAEFTPGLIIRESCEYATAMTAHRGGIPQAQVGISAAAIDAGVLEDVSAGLDRRCPGVSDAIRRAPYLTAFPAALDPSPWRETRRYRETLSSFVPLPDWWPGLQGLPLVYVTFGSVVGETEEASSVYRTVLGAVAELPVRVLMTVGRQYDPARLGPVAINTHIERWVPQAAAFAVADLVVCHGGSGTTNGALAAGLPLVVCPLFADQNRNAATIQQIGAGAVVRSHIPPEGGVASLDYGDVPALSAAIVACLTAPSYREAARRTASTIAMAPTLAETLQDLTASPRK